MRLVIVGCGRVGARLASLLDAEGHEVTIIDANAEAFRRLDPGFKGNAIIGTGVDEDVLRQGGVDQADAFAAVTDDDNTNIMASQVAKTIFGVKKVVTRIYDSTREDTYHALGLETICPTTLGATRIKDVIRRQP